LGHLERDAVVVGAAAGIVATKSILDLEIPAWAIPTPLVALLLG
jgi:hypothetical protein